MRSISTDYSQQQKGEFFRHIFVFSDCFRESVVTEADEVLLDKRPR